MAWGVREMTGGGGDAAHAGVWWARWWGDSMTGVGHASAQGYLGFRKLVNAADKFLMRIQRNTQRWGSEENPVALTLQTRCRCL